MKKLIALILTFTIVAAVSVTAFARFPDLQDEKWDWARDEILGSILQYRMDFNLPTFFTSNLTIDELETHLSIVKNNIDKVKARRIIERIKQLTTDIELISKNRRN